VKGFWCSPAFTATKLTHIFHSITIDTYSLERLRFHIVNMQREVAVHTSEGGLVGQSALAGLAHNLDINESALKVALSRAFDLLPQAGHNSILALYLSFSNMDYIIDAKRLSMVICALRRIYGASLADEQGKGDGDWVKKLLTQPPLVLAAHMYSSSYRELLGADMSRQVPNAQVSRNPYRELRPKAPTSVMSGLPPGSAHAVRDTSMGPPTYPASVSNSADYVHGMCSASYQSYAYSQLSGSHMGDSKGASASGYYLTASLGELIYRRVSQQVKEEQIG
jgi:hypothetical protein